MKDSKASLTNLTIELIVHKNPYFVISSHIEW